MALTISASHLLLHIDCNRIYERLIDPPEMDVTLGSGVWLGQHSHTHGLFKGTTQDVKFIFTPDGCITQRPNLNHTCPTCSDFLGLVQGSIDLQELLANMTVELNFAEWRLNQLESCHCERSCKVNGVVYRDNEQWLESENCRNCACENGLVECRRIFCPPTKCSADSLPVHVKGECCRKCKRYDFCAEGLNCGENSVCKNRNNRAACECKNGYASLHGDSTYCEEHDECASDQRSCDVNAICTNAVRGHLCTCKPGYVGNGTVCRALCEEGCRNGGTCVSPNVCLRPSGFTGLHCEKDIDECTEGFIQCHHHSRCINLPGWYHCECRSGFHDDGSYLLDGGSCVGFTGQNWSLQLHHCSHCSCKGGEVDCWPLACPTLPCEYTSAPEGECCPRCVTDPCVADNIVNDIRETCLDSSGISRLSGSIWTPPGSPCTTCKCKNGHSCCSVEIECLQNN